jgi:hypothetical protein
MNVYVIYLKIFSLLGLEASVEYYFLVIFSINLDFRSDGVLSWSVVLPRTGRPGFEVYIVIDVRALKMDNRFVFYSKFHPRNSQRAQ